MKPDPRLRADGLCYVCLGDRGTERSRRYSGVLAETDPFCSNACARAYHGNPLPVPAPPQYRRRTWAA